MESHCVEVMAIEALSAKAKLNNPAQIVPPRVSRAKMAESGTEV